MQAEGPVNVLAVSENYNLVITQQGELYLQPLKGHVCLPSEILFTIRGKMRHGEQAESVKKEGGSWVPITLDATTLTLPEVKMAPGQPGLDRLRLPGGPMTMESFLGRLESVGIVRTKIQAHDHVKDQDVRKITPKQPIVLEVPINEGAKGGKQCSVKNIAGYLDIAAVRNSELLSIVQTFSYIGTKNECMLGYPHVVLNKAIRLSPAEGKTELIQLAAKVGV
jgi:hypothetical protein